MNKILLIIKREYLTRVRKKTFIILTLLGPILMAALIAISVYVTQLESEQVRSILVQDESGRFKNSLSDSKNIRFTFTVIEDIESLKKVFYDGSYYALLIIPNNPEEENIELLSENQSDINIKTYISSRIEGKIRTDKLKELGIEVETIDAIDPNVHIRTIKIKEDGSEELSSTEAALAIGYISAFLIYMFIFIYGAMVMRGVIEEKTNRVVEILISSVKPFQLMMGKIIGIAMVALTQFLLWIVLGFVIISITQTLIGGNAVPDSDQLTEQMMQGANLPDEMKNINGDNQILNDVLQSVMNLPITLIIFSFIFYFIGGYLLYASLFAGIGGAVDNEADTQQFMLPLTIPLILALVVAQAIIQNPEGPAAFWFSVVPLTSPVIMMLRIPYGVPTWEIILSMGTLIITFIGTTWVAAKIYRIGILVYGKKFSYKDLWKWLRFNG
ncbi:MAG: ABC transporter permease [Bacteroidota bacterium]